MRRPRPAAEYAAKLRQARAEIYKVREQRIKQWNAERDAALDVARKAAGRKVSQARAELEAEAEHAGRQSRPRSRNWPIRWSGRFFRGRRGFPLKQNLPISHFLFGFSARCLLRCWPWRLRLRRFAPLRRSRVQSLRHSRQ